MVEDAIPSPMWRAGFYAEAPVALALVDPGGRFVNCNDRFCQVVGYSHFELSQRTWQSITHPDDLTSDEASVKELGDALVEDSFEVSKRFLHKAGHAVWVSAHVRQLRRADGAVVCLLVHCIPLIYGGAHTVSTSSGCGGSVTQRVEVRPAVSWFDLIRDNPKPTLVAGIGLLLMVGRDGVLALLNLIVEHIFS